MYFYDIPVYDDDVLKLLARFAFNAFFLFLLLRVAIRPTSADRDFAFSVVMMNVTVFFVCFALKKLELGLGMALGLFAIFGVLRYRAEAINNKEMTYLFVVITIAVINSLSNQKTSYAELLLINSIIFLAALAKESQLLQFVFLSQRTKAGKTVADSGNHDGQAKDKKKQNKVKKTNDQDFDFAADPSSAADRNALESSTLFDSDAGADEAGRKGANKRKLTVIYDRLEMLALGRAEELRSDLRQRTGLPIQRLRIQDIDLKKQTATIAVWLPESESE
ncbi:MAG: DUF4956 domain-containing protein [Planctomycetaceae bacterium]|nr:DUF4956 domain-containing protein [Planctomycetaceae bacterium]